MNPSEYNKSIRLCASRVNGYLYFCDCTHPLSYSNGVVYYHRHMASVAIGRWILPNEHVHHKDGNVDNNDPTNLEVLSASQHSIKHHPRVRPNRRCTQCGIEFRPHRGGNSFCSRDCSDFNNRKCKHPSKEELASLIEKYNWTALGRLFGVSDNAVRKWARKYELL